jgi:DNA-binding Lrp family transcriptional regulator
MGNVQYSRPPFITREEMDDTDRKLLILIGGNPRTHYQDLAKQLGISKQAVHHRIRLLTEAGVLKRAVATLSVSYVDAVPVSISGRSRTNSMKRTLDRLGKSEFTRRVVVAGGNFIFVVGYLRDISDLDSYAEFVISEAEIAEPTVGIYCLDDGLMPNYPVDGSGSRKEAHRTLSPLDLKIIAVLQDDARKPVQGIAEEVNASTKTVRHHLDRMISEGCLDFQIPMDMARRGDHLIVASVRLADGASKAAIGRKILSRSFFMDQYVRTYSNITDMVHWVFWSDDIDATRNALGEVSEYEEVLSVVPHFCYNERMYPTWKDKLVEANRLASRKPSGRTAA